jgi:putative restriction endonuclease
MLPTFLTDTLLQNLVTRLTHLKQGGVAGGKALHKPVMLLALMDVLEDSGRAKPKFIPIDETLRNQFNETWGKLIPEAKTGDFFKPVFYLPNEGFWTVFTRSNRPANKPFSSLKGAAADGLWSRFSEEYTTLLTSPEVREIVRMVILDTYFPETKYHYWASYGQPELMAEKEALIHVEEPTPRYIRQMQFIHFEGFVRHWKFRENVLGLYDHTCCISGLRAQKEMWHPLVDACHIEDHAKSGIDHPSNGLALCKNLHAAFDSGLISLSDEYRVLVSTDFRESDSGYSLHRLAGQKIRLPDRADCCPDISYIRLHRDRWKF